MAKSGSSGGFRRPRQVVQAALALLALGAAGCGASPADTAAAPTPTLPRPVEPTATAPRVSPTATPTPRVCAAREGRVERTAYTSPLLNRAVPVRVALPPCYDEFEGPLPAVYLLHGLPFSESQWDLLGADEVAAARIAAGAWPPVVLVMPLQPEPLFTQTDGGPGSYEDEMLRGLLPFVEDHYRLDARPEARALVGISRGAVWSLSIGLRHPEVFSRVAGLSPALSLNRARPAYDPLALAAGAGPFPPHLYLAAGEDDWARWGTERLSQALDAAGVEHAWVLSPGGHDSDYWASMLEAVLDDLTAGW